MDLHKLIDSFSIDEKFEVFDMLQKELDKLTTVESFCEKAQISTRLKKALLGSNLTYIELIDQDELIKLRNLGIDSVNEFISLRGESK